MTLVPRSLLWRTFLLLSLLILLSVFAWFSLFNRAEREPRARTLAQMVASVVNLTRTALVTAEPSKRRELLLDLNDREGIRIYPADEGEKISPLPDQPGLQLLAQELRRRLGGKTSLEKMEKELLALKGEEAFRRIFFTETE